MGAVIDLASRMDRLTGAVEARRAEKDAARRAAWDRVQAEHPEHAVVIAEFSRAFGRPARVVVTAAGQVLLDSARFR